MKIVGMAQIYNERKLGHLKTALDHYSKLCDEMVVLDDASTDNSVEIVREYTDHIIINSENNWEKNAETTNKARLLEKTLTLNPDWVVSFDADELFEKRVLEKDFFRNMLRWAGLRNINSLCFNWTQLWIEENWYRVDDGLGKISPPRIWRNLGNMKIEEVSGLHKRLWPQQMDNPTHINLHLLHYSSASEEKLYGKIANYLKLHPTGNYLSVLDGAVLDEADYNWFGEDYMPERKQKPDLGAVKQRIMERLSAEFDLKNVGPAVASR